MKPSADRSIAINDLLDYPPDPRQVPCICQNALCGAYMMVDYDTQDLTCPVCLDGQLAPSPEGF